MIFKVTVSTRITGVSGEFAGGARRNGLKIGSIFLLREGIIESKALKGKSQLDSFVLGGQAMGMEGENKMIRKSGD